MLLADLCAQFVNVAPNDLDSKIENAQRLICESLGVNHSSLWQVSGDNPDLLVMTHAYSDPNLKPLPLRPILKEYFPWSQRKILNSEIVCVPNTAKLPPEAAKDMESWRQYSIRSALAFPLSVGSGSVIGFVAFDSTEERDWPEPLQRRLQIFAHVIVQALERKDAEQRLRESENRFRLVADTAPVLIWMSGTNKLCTYFNKPWLDFTGRTLEQELGNGWAEGVHPDDLQRCLDTYSQSFDRRQNFRMEYRLRRHDAEYRWILDIGVSRLNQDGSFAGYVGIAVDVADRKLAEQELATANERLHLAIDSGSVGGWDFDLKTDRHVWFGKAHAQLGMAHEETLGSRQDFWDRVHEDDREHLRHAMREAKDKHEEFSEDFRVVWRDGTTHWLRSRGRYYYSANGDEPERMLGISIDITDRKRAEEALWEMNRTLEAQGSLLRSREELLKVFVKNVPAAVAMLDRDMRYLQVSDRWCSDYLQGRAQVLGLSHYEIYPDMPERWKEVHRRALQGETLRADEDRWDGQDGIHWARWEVRPWKTAEGAVGGILILAEDITRRKQMEEALSDMSRKLIGSQEQERGRIARELHDDINQRLALVAIGLDQLREKHKDLPSDVRGQVQELQQMTSDISSSVYALSHELYSSIPDSLGLARSMKSWCRDFGERRKMKIDFKSHDLPRVPQETSLCLFRVLQEALHNAAKHSGAKRTQVELAEKLGEIHLIVSDSGRGFNIEAASQNRGLGLTSMQERVRLVSGTILIESKPMGGTTIRVRVPLESKGCAQRATV
jgi:PAS domain S-box-containing protein